MSVYLGTGLEADAFAIAYLIPNILRRLFAEGSMTAAFLPTFTELLQTNDKKKSWDFAQTFFWNLTTILTLTAILGIIFSPFIINIIVPGYKNIEGKTELTIFLNRLLFPFIILVSISALEMAILNSLSIFGLPASAIIFFNISIIITALSLGRYFKHASYAFAIGVLLGGVVQVLIQVPKLLQSGMRFYPRINFRDQYSIKVAKLMIPGVFAISIAQINIYIGQYYASQLAQGSVASIYYADRIMELVLGVYAVAIFTVVLPMLSKFAANNNLSDFKDTLVTSFKLIIIVTVPASIGLIFLRFPIVEVLFKQGKFDIQSTNLTAVALLYFAIGLPGFALTKIIVSAYYSYKDTFTPSLIGIITIASNLIFINLFISKLRHGSIPLASSLSSYINFFTLLIILSKRKGKLNMYSIFPSFIKICIASSLMGLLSYLFANHFWLYLTTIYLKISLLFVFIMIALCFYAAILYLICKNDFLEFLEIFKMKN
jgi:putative peptidoglycan lipid II flippase